jgi:hypothetical protein
MAGEYRSAAARIAAQESRDQGASYAGTDIIFPAATGLVKPRAILAHRRETRPRSFRQPNF